MPLVNAVRVVEAEDAALIGSGNMRQKKGEIVSNGLATFILPQTSSRKMPEPPAHRKAVS